eukprot:CAMPEP_0174726440 /NCGR_PEP_ID=MMETSP1094-20130205/47851_1 /TAXON_ID=156173 /ORGANISM="Chrysochromulina brevifilum, Strain UTEX LB 985" /LENGTH=59 /DNA_ID=CAMNT_0015928025 /DNA_START=100 /DNA_END=276 /DNA_ORIENTATION=-
MATHNSTPSTHVQTLHNLSVFAARRVRVASSSSSSKTSSPLHARFYVRPPIFCAHPLAV